ncbi:MAG: hypothetical protein ACYDA1_05635 [Vulcanimicrobiaceae bacterium]
MKISVLALIFFALSRFVALAQTPPSASAFYLAALEATKRLETPTFATYTANLHASGAEVTFIRDPKTQELAFSITVGPNENPHTLYSAAYSVVENQSAVTLNSKPLGLTHIAMFDPTWQGVYDWLLYGFGGQPYQSAKAVLTKKPLAQPTSTPSPLHTIAVIRAMSSAIYRVRDEGAATCPNGDSGHMLHTIARRDADAHPLTDVVVDLHSGVFCSLRFGVKQSGMMGLTGYVEEHFSKVGPYWLATDVQFVSDLRLMGIAMRHLTVNIAYSDLKFPTSLPAFVPPTP